MVGGKVANLGWLSQAGSQVPPGFVVGTDGYMAHVASNDGLKRKIVDVLDGIEYGDPDALEHSMTQLREWIVQTPMPGPLVAEIERSYARLGAGAYVAVRSSGTAEDLEGASFAGLHDTYLVLTFAAART